MLLAGHNLHTLYLACGGGTPPSESIALYPWNLVMMMPSTAAEVVALIGQICISANGIVMDTGVPTSQGCH
jgi:hypothetical protein